MTPLRKLIEGATEPYPAVSLGTDDRARRHNRKVDREWRLRVHDASQSVVHAASALLDEIEGLKRERDEATSLCERYVRERTADRLLQRERKAGRIVAINNRNRRAVDDAGKGAAWRTWIVMPLKIAPLARERKSNRVIRFALLHHGRGGPANWSERLNSGKSWLRSCPRRLMAPTSAPPMIWRGRIYRDQCDALRQLSG